MAICEKFLLLKFGRLQRDILLLRVFLVEYALLDGVVAVAES